MKYDIFISYRRDGGEYTARILRDRLTDMGYRVFFDVESLRSGAFNTKLYDAIDECRDFLLVLSPGALDRCVNPDDWVRREIEFALMKGKNIVPVMLRGFLFPRNLPASMESLPYCNGLEANSQFFDAFIEKLQEFLKAKPTFGRRMARFAKRAAPILAALVVVAGLAAGGYALLSRETPRDDTDEPDETSASSLYPGTKAQERLTEEIIAYISNNLAQLETIAEAKEDALVAAREYLSSNSASLTQLQDSFYVSYTIISSVDVTSTAASEHLLGQLDDSGGPFSTTDVLYMNQVIAQFQESSLRDLSYILSLTAPENTLSGNDKLTIVSCYLDMLEAELEYHGICVNELLLPVTDESALESFWKHTLTGLTHIPLESRSWSFSQEALTSAEEKCYNTMDEIVKELAAIVGDSNVKIGYDVQSLVMQYVAQGYSQETAQRIVESNMLDPAQLQQLYYWQYTSEGYSANQATLMAQLGCLEFNNQKSARLEYAALPSDDSDTLWIKMMNLLGAGLYPEAHEAADYYEETIGKFAGIDNINTDYIPALHAFIDQAAESGIDYGVMVTAYTETKHPLLNIGDVIIAFNGTPCRTVDQYLTTKSALAADSYTVTVLRAETLEQVELEISMDMPAIYIYSLAVE